MKKLLLLVVLLQFGQIFTAAEGGPYKGGPGKRSAPSGAEPAAQRRRVDLQLLPFDSAAFIEIAGSCQYCGEAFQGQAELSEHKCEKKDIRYSCRVRGCDPSLLTNQEFINHCNSDHPDLDEAAIADALEKWAVDVTVQQTQQPIQRQTPQQQFMGPFAAQPIGGQSINPYQSMYFFPGFAQPQSQQPMPSFEQTLQASLAHSPMSLEQLQQLQRLQQLTTLPLVQHPAMQTKYLGSSGSNSEPVGLAAAPAEESFKNFCNEHMGGNGRYFYCCYPMCNKGNPFTTEENCKQHLQTHFKSNGEITTRKPNGQATRTTRKPKGYYTESHKEYLKENQDGSFSCIYPGCERINPLISIDTAQKHIRGHINQQEQQYPCALNGCGLFFKRHAEAKNHKCISLGQSANPRINTFFVCNLCSSKFTQNSGIASHMSKKHSGQGSDQHVTIITIPLCTFGCPDLFFSDQERIDHERENHETP